MKFSSMVFVGLMIVGFLSSECFCLDTDVKDMEIGTYNSKKHLILYTASSYKFTFEITGSPTTDYWFALVMSNVADPLNTKIKFEYEQLAKIEVQVGSGPEVVECFLIKRLIFKKGSD